ncbi:rod-binding protein [Sphingomonas sp. KRR8]|uniref:rod-binding protein n=1 Tax=Sphingomonas sp. KRR8 TaxID=2942996 RepID=UPI0020214357|nr:rod-binding protein [Sphingomonas sp. KRR8]URD61906.1 rod-binding protein [Sphingomonas sp. KRR8]
MTTPVSSSVTQPTKPVPPALAKTAHQFEAVFAGQVAKLMLESVDVGEFGGGHGEEMFRGVLAERVGDEMAKGTGLGISASVIQQMLKMQGDQP